MKQTIRDLDLRQLKELQFKMDEIKRNDIILKVICIKTYYVCYALGLLFLIACILIKNK